MISVRRLGFNFINVPKNASTSVRRFFIDNVVQPEDVYSDYYESETEHWSQNMAPEHAKHSHMDVAYAIDNGLLDPLETIVAVLREPLERVLSLYLYRAKQGLVDSPSITDFRRATAQGFYPDRPWQNQSQASFLQYNGWQIGDWWLLDHLECHVAEFVRKHRIEVKVPLRFQNRSLTFPTRDYLDAFYDDYTRKAVSTFYSEDVDLYQELKARMTC